MASSWDKFKRNWDASDTDIGNLLRWIGTETASPSIKWTSNGIKIVPAEEMYGEAYVNASPDQRREFLREVDRRVLDIKYPELTEETDFSSFAGGLGTVLGSIASPTSLVPLYRIAGGVKNVLGTAVQGGLWAAEYNLLDQLAEEGNVDKEELALAATAGGIITPVAAPVLSLLLKPITASAKALFPLYRRNATPSDIHKADSEFDRINDAIIEAKADGVGINPAQEAAHAEVMALQSRINSLGFPPNQRDFTNYDRETGSYFDPPKFILNKNKDRVLDQHQAKLAEQLERELQLKTVAYQTTYGSIKPDISDELIEAAAAKTNKSTDEVLQTLQLSSRPVYNGTQAETRSLIDLVEANADPISGSVYKRGGNLLGIWSTELARVFPALQKIIRRQDAEKSIRAKDTADKVRPFLQIQKAIDKKEGGNFELSLMNGDKAGISRYLNKYKDLKVRGVSLTPNEAYGQFRKTFDGIYNELDQIGVDIKYLENYFPRVVEDFDGLLKELGKKRESRITAMFRERAQKLGIGVDELSDIEKSNIINGVVRGIRKDPTISSLSNKEQRAIINLNERLKKYYADPDVSVERYIRNAIDDIELRKLFGRRKGDSWNLDDSVGNIIAKGREKNLFNPDNEERIISLLKARYGEGRRSPSKLNRLISNTGYMGTLANPLSAVTQIGDIATSMGLNGILRTIINSAPWARKIKFEELGLERLLAEMDSGAGAKTLGRLLGLSGFSRVDRWGKNTLLNASLSKLASQARTSRGVERMREKYGVMYGDDFQKLVDDFRAFRKNKKVTALMKSALFSELADAQPTIRSEMPTAWLLNPNARLLYQLKSFTLKQLDIMRREIFQKLKTPGKRMEGARMLIVYPTLLGAAGATTTAIKDIMLGRQDALDPEKFDDKFVENILKVVGANKYMLDQMASGRTGGGDFVVDLISPPAVGMLNAFTNIVSAAGDPEELEKDVNYAMSYAPMLGRFWYNFYGGGLERYEEGLWEGGRGLSLDIMGNN
mgnify:FL=1